MTSRKCPFISLSYVSILWGRVNVLVAYVRVVAYYFFHYFTILESFFYLQRFIEKDYLKMSIWGFLLLYWLVSFILAKSTRSDVYWITLCFIEIHPWKHSEEVRDLDFSIDISSLWPKFMLILFFKLRSYGKICKLTTWLKNLKSKISFSENFKILTCNNFNWVNRTTQNFIWLFQMTVSWRCKGCWRRVIVIY